MRITSITHKDTQVEYEWEETIKGKLYVTEMIICGGPPDEAMMDAMVQAAENEFEKKRKELA